MSVFMMQEPESGGRLIARSLGAGLGGGLQQGITQQLENFYQQQQMAPLLNLLQPSNMQTRDMLGEPQELSDQQIGAAGLINPQFANVLQQQKAARQKKEMKYFEKNEPKLIELGENLNTLKQEALRFRRMEELSKDSDKFPSSFTTALFTKDGQLRDVAYSQLSPEAQEFIKLVIDNISGAKDTFGARVTDFDVKTYLKKLPSLLNTPEARKRILRDLQGMNKINQLYSEGISEIFEENGGSGSIPFSTAHALFKKKYKNELQALEEEYVFPKEENFKGLPKPGKYSGRKIRNKSTGEIFISDGKNWTLIEEKSNG
jgi:hypothetical protein